jgi:hypothetical protein
MLRVCNRCERALDEQAFGSRNDTRDGKATACKDCVNVLSREYHNRTRDRRLELKRKWRAENREKKSEYNRRWKLNNPEKVAAIKERDRQKRIKAAEERAAKIDPVIQAQLLAEREQRRKENKRAQHRRRRARYKSDSRRRLNASISRHIRDSLFRGAKAGRSWQVLVGYTKEELCVHLERQFTKGMSWDNYGPDGWHIDHIIPLAAFKYERPEDSDFQVAWGLPNLRPLWAKDNIAKGDKILTLL